MADQSSDKENEKKPRRAKGEGSITQRRDGTFQGMLDLGIVAGKRQRRYVYGKTMSEAARKLRELRTHIEQNANAENKRAEQTVAEYVTYWYDTCVAGNGEPSTQSICLSRIRYYIIPAFGDVQLKDLKSSRIQKWVNTLKTTRRLPTYIPRNANGERDEAKTAALAAAQPLLSSRGIEIIFGVLNRALKYAVDEQIIALNPAKTVILPPVSIYEPRVLSDEEVERILQAIRGERLETLYHLWICLGLRRGEALKLKWKDLNLESGKASLFIRKGKTPASRRTIPLSDELVESLLHHREHQQREQEHFGVKWNPKSLVFPSLAGTSLIGRNVYRHYKALLVKAGVEEKKPTNGAQVPAPDLDDDEPSVRIHDLRHWMCSYLLREGTPIKEVQEIMGHSTVSTTLKVYAHVIGDNKRQAVNQISQLLKKNG